MLASYLIGRGSFGVAVVIVVVVPIVIWVVKLVFVAMVFWLLANVKRISRGRKPIWPKSLWDVFRWIHYALRFVSIGG